MATALVHGGWILADSLYGDFHHHHGAMETVASFQKIRVLQSGTVIIHSLFCPLEREGNEE